MNQTDEPAAPATASPDSKLVESRRKSAPIPNRSGSFRAKRARPSRQSAERQPVNNDASTTESTINAESAATGEDTDEMTPTPETASEAGQVAGIDLAPEFERAEALLDELGHRAGGQLTDLGRALLRTIARAREEAEDIWAEANSIRRGGR